MEERKVVNGPSVSCTLGLNADGINTCRSVAFRLHGRVREGEKHHCVWCEACKAADYVLEHFGNKSRDRGFWFWCCLRFGLNMLLDIADEAISSSHYGELRWPIRALQWCLQEVLTKGRGRVV